MVGNANIKNRLPHHKLTATVFYMMLAQVFLTIIIILKMEIEINGVKYQPKQTQQTSPKKTSKSLTMLYGMAMMFGSQGSVGSSKHVKQMLSKVELVKEYELIQQKKSSLSRKHREGVIYQFERTFEIVPS